MKILTPDQRLIRLKEVIAQLETGSPTIAEASYCAYDICIGDFWRIGFADKLVSRDGIRWQWLGPKGIFIG